MRTQPTRVATLSLPFRTVHAALGVIGSLSARTRHLDSPDTVSVAGRHRNIVTFSGTPENLAAYLERLNTRGLLSPFVYQHARGTLIDQAMNPASGESAVHDPARQATSR